MSNNYFDFRRFRVCHDLCAMKVGTDGVLLGAWAAGGEHVLDVGTGSGLIALCMAQRFPDADVTAIDIDRDACIQAGQNVDASPFSGRINVRHTSLQQLDGGEFDSIVCNPPFFKDSLHCPDRKRTLARHADSLTTADLMRNSARLLTDGGRLSVIIPSSLCGDYECEAFFAGLIPSRVCVIRTVPHKPASRCMLEYTKGKAKGFEKIEVCLNNADGKRSEWFSELTKDFYL